MGFCESFFFFQDEKDLQINAPFSPSFPMFPISNSPILRFRFLFFISFSPCPAEFASAFVFSLPLFFSPPPPHSPFLLHPIIFFQGSIFVVARIGNRDRNEGLRKWMGVLGWDGKGGGEGVVMGMGMTGQIKKNEGERNVIFTPSPPPGPRCAFLLVMKPYFFSFSKVPSYSPSFTPFFSHSIPRRQIPTEQIPPGTKLLCTKCAFRFLPHFLSFFFYFSLFSKFQKKKVGRFFAGKLS